MNGNAGLITYGLASIAFAVLSVLLLAQWRVRPIGPALLLATSATMLWAGVIAAGTLYPYPPVTLMQLSELARVGGWLFFLLQLLGFQEDGDPARWLGRNWRRTFALVTTVALGVVLLRPFARNLPIEPATAADLTLTLWLALAISGLLLVEQLYRNANATERWGIKFLCLGLGALFAYDFFMYAEALLFRQLNAQLWQARGILALLITPWLAIAIARNRQWRMTLYVSRHVVFHTVTLMGAGLYLLAMAVIGYFIKYLGGSWGGVLQIGFLAGGGVLLATLLFSANLRARLRVYLSKHFFSYRFDYREEWLRFTDALARLRSDDAAPGVIQAMAPLVLCKSGALLQRDASGQLEQWTLWERPALHLNGLGNIAAWVSESGWIIDLREWRSAPDLYLGLNLPLSLQYDPDTWLIVPLFFQGELEALLLLDRTDLKDSVNWEDRDLLKTAGRQAAALLAQQRASHALVEARQFDAFNRLSAYVIHDLKNILAQQSLIVSNAQKHRDNPAFIDDMIMTVDNSVQRMQKLMHQMRSGMRTAEPGTVDLAALLERVVAGRAHSRPVPVLPEIDAAAAAEDAAPDVPPASGAPTTPATARPSLAVTADRERLATVFSHLIQNAQEATPDDGEVALALAVEGDRARVTIRDTGSGMSEAFIRDKLFKPFESTKGLTGMGIGAFESREYVRQLGGEISVESTVGAGSTFSVVLPLLLYDQSANL